MKKILGLDLGTNSIGWALVNEAENDNEKSSIIRLGVRVNPLTTGKGGELDNFTQGKSITTNADRTLKRSMRRNLQRYKLRRENLIEILKANGFISDETILSENGNRTTFETYRLRAKAATEEITLEQFARVLLQINKKRGYKSSRKAKGQDEGQLIDGMEVAKRLYNENLTPGQLCLELVNANKKYLPDFYRSDLQNEFDRIYKKQQEFYPEILTDELHKELRGKKRDAVYAICVKHFVWKEKHTEWSNEEARNMEVEKEHTIVGFKRNGNANDQKKENLEWRVKGLTDKLHLEELVVVLQEINTKINGSSGYLGAISDRSKELYFNKQTVGQYQMAILAENPNASLRNMVFYRQDYLDEFNTIWDKQAEYHNELTNELKSLIRDGNGKIGGMFFQRRLKSQKGLISFCEFESREIEVEIDGKKKTKTVGSRVIPRSSPLFQEFKIWQILNNLEVSNKEKKSKKKKDNSPSLFAEQEDTLQINGKRELEQEEKELLAAELSVKEKLSKAEILKLLFDNPQELDLNFKEVQGNLTQAKLIQAYITIIERATGEIIDTKKPAADVLNAIENTFKILNYNTDILYFNSDAALDEQPMYRLWHLLYSFEGDNSNTGNEKLIEKVATILTTKNTKDTQSSQHSAPCENLCVPCGKEMKEYASILANIAFQDDYGSLSAKAINKILPHLKDGNKYDVAVEYAGYGKHSKSSLTKDEIASKKLKDKLEILPKNSLRNPVVEKILNQMINVINAIIDTYGKPDEIRVELARELKKNAKEREELTAAINKTTGEHKEIKGKLESEFDLKHVSRTDIVRYKLYQELKATGYKTLYSGTYISPAKLFTGEFDIEHIIPQARLFDDSFSNKTLEKREVNIKKGNKTAYDFVKEEYGEEGLETYLQRVENLYNIKSRNNEDDEIKTAGTISKGKYNKLKMTEADIPEGFIDRDLRNTQYIAKKSLEILHEICRRVVATTGSVTDELREDWQLIDVMKELNWEKYKTLDLIEYFEDRDGRKIGRIKDWTKRNDHRHHAMDALTVAFTKDVLIQYFNNKNASFTANTNEYAIKTKYFENSRAIPPMPLNEFRAEAKKHLENTLISIKAKNKVTTNNINITKKSGGTNKKLQQTPRGQLHNEAIYGSIKKPIVKIDKTTGKKTITFETIYTIRKEIVGSNPTSKQFVPDKKGIEGVIDAGIQKILSERLDKYDGSASKAFSNKEENPILNKNGKPIKSCTLKAPYQDNVALHDRRDKEGNFILDDNDKKQPVDFVNTNGNHHAEIFKVLVKDKKGNPVLDDKGNPQYKFKGNVISFFDSLARVNAGVPIIDKEYRDNNGIKLEDAVFEYSMKANEYFVMPKIESKERVNEETGEVTTEEVVTFNPQDIDLLNPDNYYLISSNLFRVQKLDTGGRIHFIHHLEAGKVKEITGRPALKDIAYTSKAISNLQGIVKVRVNHIGQIVKVGEY
ncbi:MAG: type II CRISPR RNA-guided endonuclease Cas9 [Cytophagaceae bacterium]|jgi:CRISPR-associated endonuclease Csn1|nr:type II CRISPR RNA-guided endonuclease Cas9 [Cytophagaceae bacterium]